MTTRRLSDADTALSKQFVDFLSRLKFDKTLACFAGELKDSIDQSSTAANGKETASTPKASKDAKENSREGQGQGRSGPSRTVGAASPSNPPGPTSPKQPVKVGEGAKDDKQVAPPPAPTVSWQQPPKSLQRPPFDHWAPSESGIITVPGDPSELWEIEDLGGNQAPSYLLGAGLVPEEHELERVKEPELVPCNPYQKETPPPGPLETFDMRIIYESGKTGFESVKEFPIVVGDVIAGRYQVTEYVGSAAFSRAVQCIDLKFGHDVCIKIIRNGKDFFDQALDEIKLLQYINSCKDPDEAHVLQLYDFFYYKEHVFLVCELLRDNLYEFAKYNREEEEEFYFTLPRVRKIAKQVLTALSYIHSLNLLHCDLKPENILIKSYSRCEVKVIDFGSSCFTTDSLSSYVQSRCYRAPEVVLGLKYDGRIDVWSLGAILPELVSGNVLFQADSAAAMLARMAAILGPFPASMLHGGRHTCRFVSKHGVFYETEAETGRIMYHFPRRTELKRFLGTDDPLFFDFITRCLTLDPAQRPTAAELLQHPFILAQE
jgi:hypothetical protein